MKPITLQQAKELKVGTTLYHHFNENKDGTPQRWRVTGKPKIWKRDPSRVQVPIKNGLRNYGYLTEKYLDCVSLDDPTLEKL